MQMRPQAVTGTSRLDGLRQAALLEELLEGGDGKLFAGRFESFAEPEEARGMVTVSG
jgi:hypothetical protein